ncbi:MAG: hypothetical protein K0R67_1450 [Paenibacillus sp.]|nr:hypothetical protein [Paenibacillus sp.]
MQAFKLKRQPSLRLWLSLCIGSTLVLCSGCGLQSTDPDKLFDHAVAALSGKDNFTFAGSTQYALNGMPPQQGLDFKGTITGHNQLMMQVVTGGEREAVPLNAKNSPGVNRRSEQGNAADVTVQLNRSEDEWIVTENPAPGQSTEQLVRWNPVAHLERLNRMHKQITATRNAETPGMTLLSVVPEPSEISEVLRTELDEQVKLLEPARKLQELQQTWKLSDQQTAAMRGEVETSLAAARARIEEMRSSLSADATYTIGVDRQSNLPKTMQVQTVIHYNVDGTSKEETTEVSYTFGE